MKLSELDKRERTTFLKAKDDFKYFSSSERVMQLTEVRNRGGRTGLLASGGANMKGFTFYLLNISLRQG